MNDTGNTSWQREARCLTGQIICPFGIVSSMLGMASLWRKVTVDKTAFFIFMFIISMMDFVFSVFFVYVRCSSPSIPVAVFTGLVFSASLASDLCTLALTLERYLSLCWPQQMRNLSPMTGRIIHTIGGVLIGVLSLTRMQYVVHGLETLTPLPGGFLRVWAQLAVVLSIFGDMVLPFALIVFMGAFSVKIITVVRNRRKKVGGHTPEAAYQRKDGVGSPTQKVISVQPAVGHHPKETEIDLQAPDKHVPPGSSPDNGGAISPAKEQQHQKHHKHDDDGHSVISLVLVLDILFILNQLGYCAVAVAEVLEADDRINQETYFTASFISDVVECLCRCVSFYCYMRFSTLMRHEFVAVVAKVRSKVRSITSGLSL